MSQEYDDMKAWVDKARAKRIEWYAECKPYLKDGERPAQRIERERADCLAVAELLAKEKFKNERLRAENVALRAAFTQIAQQLRAGGGSLPAPQPTGTIEGAMNTGLSIALCLVTQAIEDLELDRGGE